MTDIKCSVCLDEIPSRHINDAKWGEFMIKKKQHVAHICRSCMYMIAQGVIDEFD